MTRRDEIQAGASVVRPRPRKGSPEARLERLEKALLLASHVGATAWSKPLQDLLDEIERDLRPMT